jgi:hypothetical protein
MSQATEIRLKQLHPHLVTRAFVLRLRSNGVQLVFSRRRSANTARRDTTGPQIGSSRFSHAVREWEKLATRYHGTCDQLE